MRLSRRSFLIGGGATAAAAAVAGGGALAQRPQALADATPIPVSAAPIPHLAAADPGRSRFGALQFRSGLDLTSPVSAFGGFSGLWRSGDGREILALADNAQLLKARIERSADGALSGLSQAVLAPLRLAGGKALRQSRFYDTESLALAGNAAFVGVERHHAVIRFQRDRTGMVVRGAPIPVPAELGDLPSNNGLEAIGVAPRRSPLAGAVVAVSERARSGDEAPTRGYILTGPSRGGFDVVRSHGYDISDLAFLDSGDCLLLERRFGLLGGFGCRIRRIDGGAIRPGARVDGEVLFESDATQRIDNMEGLAVHREGGSTLLTLISDNNFHAVLQRTLLLEFALVA